MKFSLRFKLILFSLCIVFLVGGSISLFSIYQQRQRILELFEEDAIQTAALISGTIVNDLYFFNVSSLRVRLESARANPDIRFTYVTDLEGALLTDGTRENPQRGRRLTDGLSRQMPRSNQWLSAIEGETLRVAGPVFAPDRSRIGYLQVGFGLADADKVVREATTRSLFITVVCLVIGAALAVILSTGFTRPILSIMGAAGRIGEGKLDVRLSIDRTDELGVLAESVNRMADSLQAREAEANRTAEELRLNMERIRALHEIDLAITSTLNLRAVLDLLLEKMDVFLPFPAATTVRLLRKPNGFLEPVACRNIDEAEWKAAEWKSGRGLAEAVFETKSPVMVRNAQDDSRVRDVEFFRRYGLVSYLGIPLMAHNEVLGVLGFYAKEEHRFDDKEVEFLSTLAGQAAIAIHNARLYEDVRNRETQLQDTNRMLSALHSVAAAASESLNLDEVLQAAIKKITEIFDFDATQIHLYDEKLGELRVGASFEKDPSRFVPIRSFKKGEGNVGRVAESGKAVIFEDVRTDPAYQSRSRAKISSDFGYCFFAVFPINGRLKNLGTLACTGVEPRKLNSGEIQLLEALTDQLAVAVENSGLYGEVRQKVEELQQKTTDLERANKVKDEFLSVMSHELRTPLTAVSGYVGLMREGMFGDINQKQHEACGKVLRRTADLLSMVNSILYTTSLEAEAVQVEKHALDLEAFLRELKSLYDGALEKPVKLTWAHAPGLPEIQTDSSKLKHVLRNLINNAIKFTEKGEVRVSARVVEEGRRQEAEGKSVEFKVVDTGVGIPKEMQSVIFEKFKQIDSSETRLYGGVGLGLYIVKQFTETIGGEIEVESEVGKGSTFTVRIPI